MGSFGIVIVVVAVVGGIVAIAVSVASGGLYERIGKGAFTLDTDERRPAPTPAAARAEADEEIRQLVEAKSARRVMRGEPPLDVDAEVAALKRTASPPAGADAALRDEVRQLVVARNARRVARGQDPLDVEAEVERQLRDLGA